MAEAEIAGRYTRRGTLGTGAGTVVYEAFDRLIERRVAVKVVTLPPIDDPETADAIARFRRGAKAAGGLSHPNIVAVFDYGEDAERAWIVMELVEGGSLKAVLDSGERLPIPVIVRLMGQVLDGLGYSHARGVVHRDIKPANIMLTPAGTAKITDFGIARLENSSMTHVGTMMGTPAYMAPAIPRRKRRPPRRYLVGRRGAVPIADRREAVRRRHHLDHAEGAPCRAGAALQARPRPAPPPSMPSSPGRWRSRRRTASPARPSSTPRCARRRRQPKPPRPGMPPGSSAGSSAGHRPRSATRWRNSAGGRCGGASCRCSAVSWWCWAWPWPAACCC